jgi:hypothetical protein
MAFDLNAYQRAMFEAGLTGAVPNDPGGSMETYYDGEMMGWVTVDETGNIVGFEPDPSAVYQESYLSQDTFNPQLEQVDMSGTTPMPDSFFIPGISDPANILFPWLPGAFEDPSQATTQASVADLGLISSSVPETDAEMQTFFDQLFASDITVSTAKTNPVTDFLKNLSGGAAPGGSGGGSAPKASTAATTAAKAAETQASSGQLISGISNNTLLLAAAGLAAFMMIKK